jgi:hypothetical protein
MSACSIGKLVVQKVQEVQQGSDPARVRPLIPRSLSKTTGPLPHQGRQPAHSDLLRIGAISADTPLRLDVAAALAYPDGSMTASGLRREHKRGRLIIERTAVKDYNCAGGWRHE